MRTETVVPAGIVAVVPYLEALDSSGRWVQVSNDIGFPAGLARTMVADLSGRLPRGTRRIRISTNLRIYWDQIQIDATPEGTDTRLREVPLAEAQLGFRGYPREVRGNPAADIRYVYEEVSQTGPYAQHLGYTTRYGDVHSLLRQVDDQFVVFGTGEEIALEFDPSGLPPLPAGWTRDYFFFLDGFSKDMDFYAAHGDTVDPLPFHGMGEYPYPESRAYPHPQAYLESNTRARSGRAPTRYRFQYR